ncbi:MAG: hypothetical protein NDJ90_08180 [Oligoflexia bacterium]|nr:hypothetical protein [Oligoflexia bacterium]
MRAWIGELDSLIRQGKSRLARRRLEDWVRARSGSDSVDRPFLAELAALCRRSGIPGAAVRLLNPVVRPKPRVLTLPTGAEKAEYAAALAQLGADREARALLEGLDPRETPEALLYGAFARFPRWEYAAAIPLLEAYLAHSAIAPYQRRIGEVNLLAALAAVDKPGEEGFRKAEALAEKLLRETCEEENLLLHGNTLGLLAQLRIAQRNFGAAREALDEAEQKLREAGTLDALYIRKWKAIAALGDASVRAPALEELNAVRAEAATRANWETVRDCDFHRAAALGDVGALTHLYFGTPFASYRARISRLCTALGARLPESYLWAPHPRRRNERAWGAIDARTGEFLFRPGDGGRGRRAEIAAAETATGGAPRGRAEAPHRPAAALKTGQVPHRLLAALAMDFYKPQILPALHAELFPDRYFNPVSSRDVVHQAMKRLRAWLAEVSAPVAVVENRGSFSLEFHGPVGIRVHRAVGDRAQRGAQEQGEAANVAAALASTRLSALIERLKGGLGLASRQVFSRADVARALGISERAANVLLAEALGAGIVRREGRGPSTRYRCDQSTSSSSNW